MQYIKPTPSTTTTGLPGADDPGSGNYGDSSLDQRNDSFADVDAIHWLDNVYAEPEESGS